LRIGVVLGDRLVEERLFTGEGPVTVGQSLRCALSLPVEGVPREHVLAAVDQGHFMLRLAAGMEAKVARKGGAIEVITGPAELRIEAGLRGRVRIGEATILLQEVARPASTPRPQLPAAVRGSFADRIDSRLAMIIGVSLVVHIVIAVWAWQGDVEHVPLGMPEPVASFSIDTIDMTDPVLAPPAPTPGIASPVSPVQTPPPIVHPTHVTATMTHRPTGDDAARLAAILASPDETAGGPADMSHRQPGADLDKQIAEVKGHPITIGDNGHTSRADDRARVGTGTDPLPIDDPTLTRAPDHGEHEDGGRIVIKPEPTRGDDPLPDNVLLKIQTLYVTGLQRCYRKALVVDAQLSGKITISFTIDERGHTIDAAAAGMSAQLTSCVESQMASWRFAIPRNKAGEPTEQSFHVSLVLRPS
jgi:hypothetical protein